LNPAVNEIYEPGSTFKMITTCAALAEHIFKPTDVIFCENGSYNLTKDVSINDHEKRGYLTFEGTLAYSSNIGFAKIGMKLGKEKLFYWVRNFGFGSLTGSRLPGENKGLVYNPYNEKKWSSVTTPNIAFGQGISITGLQLVNAYSAIANGGLLYEPQVVKQVVDNNHKIKWSSQPRIIRRIVSPETASTVTSLLTKVVDYGTGKFASVDGYSCAGKTGTAQKADPVTKKYSVSRYVASFCGFLPAENPRLVILVVVDEPQTTYWASDIACPVFANIGKKAMNYLNIPKTKSVVRKEIASIN
jgi:cell division protein FtsI (penicillin-binding protein 3)